MKKSQFEAEAKLDTMLKVECTCCYNPCNPPLIVFG